MITSKHTFVINTSIDNVWKYVEDIRGWASIFPGHQSCNIINENDSEWVIKVSAAGVTRTDTVQVCVEQWDGPERVNFVYNVDDLPVEGKGVYSARSVGAHETEVTLDICIIGSGPMTAMWEAIGAPLLPQFVKAFATKLKAEVERVAGVGTASAADTGFAIPMATGLVKSTFAALRIWIKNLFGWSPKTDTKD
ncbi:SRPBCC family protein [Ketobacter sp.]|nr:MAG: SRPBCC family protein [Ketobacter sp.]